MKKTLSILLVLAMAFSLTTAMAESTANDKNFVITLTANPTTGYSWQYVASDEVIAVEEEFLTSADIDKLAGIEPVAEPIAGEGGLSVFTVKGVKPGDAIIALQYGQSWDESSTVAGLTYFLRVNDDLSVVCVSTACGL